MVDHAFDDVEDTKADQHRAAEKLPGPPEVRPVGGAAERDQAEHYLERSLDELRRKRTARARGSKLGDERQREVEVAALPGGSAATIRYWPIRRRSIGWLMARLPAGTSAAARDCKAARPSTKTASTLRHHCEGRQLPIPPKMVSALVSVAPPASFCHDHRLGRRRLIFIT